MKKLANRIEWRRGTTSTVDIDRIKLYYGFDNDRDAINHAVRVNRNRVNRDFGTYGPRTVLGVKLEYVELRDTALDALVEFSHVNKVDMAHGIRLAVRYLGNKCLAASGED